MGSSFLRVVIRRECERSSTGSGVREERWRVGFDADGCAQDTGNDDGCCDGQHTRDSHGESPDHILTRPDRIYAECRSDAEW